MQGLASLSGVVKIRQESGNVLAIIGQKLGTKAAATWHIPSSERIPGRLSLAL
jgi:hypothetical protein